MHWWTPSQHQPGPTPHHPAVTRTRMVDALPAMRSLHICTRPCPLHECASCPWPSCLCKAPACPASAGALHEHQGGHLCPVRRAQAAVHTTLHACGSMSIYRQSVRPAAGRLCTRCYLRVRSKPGSATMRPRMRVAAGIKHEGSSKDTNRMRCTLVWPAATNTACYALLCAVL
jgi:hypothetical protein